MNNADRQARFRKRREEELARLKTELEVLRNAGSSGDTTPLRVPLCNADGEPLLEEVDADGKRLRTLTLAQFNHSIWLQRAYVSVLEIDNDKLIEEFNELVDDYNALLDDDSDDAAPTVGMYDPIINALALPA
jgi:hypothetical protein